MSDPVVIPCNTCPTTLNVPRKDWHGLPPGWKGIRSYWLCPTCWKRYRRGPRVKMKRMQCKHIPDLPILELLARNPEVWHTHRVWAGTFAQDDGHPVLLSLHPAMPPDTPDRLALAKMRQMIRRGVVDGCACGCRGDFTITDKGVQEMLVRQGVEAKLEERQRYDRVLMRNPRILAMFENIASALERDLGDLFGDAESKQ